jgi:5-methylcytosine-specific restriction endonuclease McrBC regulatory subunit McrC
MIRLILREGERYSAENIRTQVFSDQPAREEIADLSEEKVTLLVKRIIGALIELRLPSTQLPTVAPVPLSEDVENEDALDDERDEDNRVYLARPTRNGGLAIKHLVGSATLQWQPSDNLPPVAVEVLPKITHGNDEDDRAGLRRMWEYACDLNLREEEQVNEADDARMPLHEWLIQRFLQQVEQLLARGIRAQYVEDEGNLLAVRGRLSIQENLRQNVHAPHRFYCRFEEFSPNRPENRLIKSAILAVRAQTQVPNTRRRAAHLVEWLHEVPSSYDVSRDFTLWRTDRLMTHYLAIRPTCEWILRSQSASPVAGVQSMIGRFVRMNDVFERYVTRWLQERCRGDYRVFGQGEGTSTLPLCRDMHGRELYPMRPDIRITRHSHCVAILDAKWKSSRDDGKLASGGDLYQMFAYASHWLNGFDHESEPRLIGLIYPATNDGEISYAFSYPKLDGVTAMALRFHLPRRTANGQWCEGFLVDQATLNMAPYLPLPLSDWTSAIGCATLARNSRTGEVRY